MSRDITFVNNTKTTKPILEQSTGDGETKSKYEDYTYKDGYKELQLKFNQKITWLRFLPPIKGTEYGWLMPFNVFKAVEGQSHPTFVDPESFGQPSIWATARGWFMKNAREELMKKDVNPHGLKLRSTPRGLAWAIVSEAPKGESLKLLNTSLYDGKYGGSTGLGFDIIKNAEVRDNEPGSPTIGSLVHGDITATEKGKLVCIEKSVPEVGDTKYASYSSRIGKSDAPLQSYLDLLSDEEYEKLVQLEQVLRIPTEEEQRKYLLAYIGESWYSKIFPNKE
jgi:hypothetical protein